MPDGDSTYQMAVMVAMLNQAMKGNVFSRGCKLTPTLPLLIGRLNSISKGRLLPLGPGLLILELGLGQLQLGEKGASPLELPAGEKRA